MPSPRHTPLEYMSPLVVFTGSGVSAESGIPTFRDKGGLWKSHRPEELATPSAFIRNPQLVWEFYNWRRNLVASCDPNPAHLTLAQIEIEIDDFSLITQNIDGLHQRAGNKNILELHGSLWELRCTVCKKTRIDREIPEVFKIPTCNHCGEMMRPNVVWFGERLDPEILRLATKRASRARTMLVIGTSALVYPANSLPMIAKNAGAHLIEVNPSKTPISPIMDLHLSGSSGEIIPSWWRSVRGNSLNSDKHLPLMP
ncbi:MAG: NAD-dependent deacylase [Anaerolineales bacterium]